MPVLDQLITGLELTVTGMVTVFVLLSLHGAGHPLDVQAGTSLAAASAASIS